jgi:hypothetical protein
MTTEWISATAPTSVASSHALLTQIQPVRLIEYLKRLASAVQLRPGHHVFALTSLTRFLFPFKGATPAVKLGIISLLVLAIAIVTWYTLHLAWRETYIIACAVFYFNVFVLVVQSFERVPQLKAIPPTQKELPFAIAQISCFGAFCYPNKPGGQEI